MCQFVDLWLALKGLVSLLEMRLFDLVVVNLRALAMLLLLLLQAQVLDEVFDLFIAVGVLDGGRLLAVEGPRVQASPELSIVHGTWLVVVLAGRLMSMLKLAINLVCDGKFRKV